MPAALDARSFLDKAERTAQPLAAPRADPPARPADLGGSPAGPAPHGPVSGRSLAPAAEEEAPRYWVRQPISKIIRSRWLIENRLRFGCDAAFREDASKIRTGHGPENPESMATLHRFAIDQLRAAGHTDIAPALREISALRPFARPPAFLGLS